MVWAKLSDDLARFGAPLLPDLGLELCLWAVALGCTHPLGSLLTTQIRSKLRVFTYTGSAVRRGNRPTWATFSCMRRLWLSSASACGRRNQIVLHGKRRKSNGQSELAELWFPWTETVTFRVFVASFPSGCGLSSIPTESVTAINSESLVRLASEVPMC